MPRRRPAAPRKPPRTAPSKPGARRPRRGRPGRRLRGRSPRSELLDPGKAVVRVEDQLPNAATPSVVSFHGNTFPNQSGESPLHVPRPQVERETLGESVGDANP